jgi:acyl-CoA dehydrogenase
MTHDDGGFRMPEELSALRDQVGRIIRDEIIPIEQKIDPDAAEIPEDDYRRLAKKAQAAGMWCMSAPQKYGGGGLGTFAMCVLTEEMAQHRMGLYNPGAGVFGRNPPPVIYGGSEEQIQAYAVPTLKNGWHTFFAITEPSGGSDPAGAIQCRAVRKGDTYVLNGTKIFISHAHEAEWGVVFTRTDPKAGRSGITCFIIKKGQPGFSARPIRTLRTSALPNEVSFEDCAVPLEQRLGEEGQGLNLCLDLLTRLRFPYSACNIGVAAAALRMAIEQARRRSTFGELLARRQAVQWMLADSEVEIRAARWLTWEGAWKADRGEDSRMEASIAKLYTSEVLGRVVDRAVQIHGGYGVSKELPLERWYREARIRRIGEGPSEVHRMVIARNLLR